MTTREAGSRPLLGGGPSRHLDAAKALISATIVAAIVLLPGCGPRNEPAARHGADSLDHPVAVDTSTAAHAALPDSKPDIHGVITAVEGVRIRVEEDPHAAGGANKASLRIEPHTLVMRRSGETASSTDLRVGTRVSAWYEGPVMESYPVQALARAIVIEPDSL